MKLIRGICVAILALSAISFAQTGDALTTPYNAAFSGTYTYGSATVTTYLVMSNQANRQVGFCNSSFVPYGYYCREVIGQDLYTGKLVADGAGNITNTSSLTVTTDPNSYKCSSANKAVGTCPFIVPSTTTWDSVTTFAVGATVIDGSNSYQALAANTNAEPVLITNGSNPQVGNACAMNTTVGGTNHPKCTWVLLYGSATGANKSGTVAVTGTYKIQANGTGSLQLGPAGSTPGTLLIVVSPHLPGQQIQIYGQPTLGNEMHGSGTAVLQ